MTIAQQIAHSFLDNIEKMIVRNDLDVVVYKEVEMKE